MNKPSNFTNHLFSFIILWVFPTFLMAQGPCETLQLNGSDAVNGDYFGVVSTYNDLIAVGSPWQNNSRGAVYIYKDTPSGWEEIAKLTALDPSNGAQFGSTVYLTNNRLIVGAIGENGIGAVYAFEHNGVSFFDQEKITSSDGTSGDQFGTSIANLGRYLVIGAPYKDDGGHAKGAVYIFRKQVSGWQEQTILQSADIHDFDIFGSSVAIAPYRIAIGAIGAQNNNGVRVGAVYIYDYTSQSGWSESAKLMSPSGDELDFLGRSISMDYTGTLIAAGADGDDDNGSNAGAIYVFEYQPGTSWNLETKLLASDGSSFANLGFSMTLNKHVIASGAPWEGDNGAVYLYLRQQGGNWVETAKIEASVEGIADEFGTDVSVFRKRLVVGSPLHSNEFGPGAAYLYDVINCSFSIPE